MLKYYSFAQHERVIKFILALIFLYVSIVLNKQFGYQPSSQSIIQFTTGLFFTAYILLSIRTVTILVFIQILADLYANSNLPLQENIIISSITVLITLLSTSVFKLLYKKKISAIDVNFLLIIGISGLFGSLTGGSLVYGLYGFIYTSLPDLNLWISLTLSNLAGIVLICPLVINWKSFRFSEYNLTTRSSNIELVALVVSTIAITFIIFYQNLFDINLTISFPYLILPFLFWAAVRFHSRVLSSLLIIITILIVYFTEKEIMFVNRPGNNYHHFLNSIQIFIIFMNFFSYIIASIIYARNESNKRIMENEILYKTLIDSLPQAIFVKNSNSRFVSVNKSFAGLLNLEPEDFINKTDYDFFPAEIAEKYIRDDKEVLKSLVIREFEEKFHSKNSVQWINTTKVPLMNSEGEFNAILGIFWDITQRKNIEAEKAQTDEKIRKLNEKLEERVISRTIELNQTLEALRQSEAQFREAFENAMQGMALINPDGSFQKVNQALCDMMGYSSQQLMPKSLRKITVREDYIKEIQILKKLLAGDISNYHIEKRILHRDNFEIWVSESNSLVKTSDGQPLHIVSQITDITERKQAENQLRKYSETLTVLLREVNHRVKNNLSALISMLHMEEEKALAKGNKAFLNLLSDLVSRIQGLATVHSMLSATNWQPLELNVLCEQIVRGVMNSNTLGDKVKIEIESSKMKVNSNQAHHLTLVFNELATNYIKYGLKDFGECIISIYITNENDKIRILFKDNGPGYPETLINGDFSDAGIGFELIKGIVTRSLDGEMKIYNDNGAIIEISFVNDLET